MLELAGLDECLGVMSALGYESEEVLTECDHDEGSKWVAIDSAEEEGAAGFEDAADLLDHALWVRDVDQYIGAYNALEAGVGVR